MSAAALLGALQSLVAHPRVHNRRYIGNKPFDIYLVPNWGRVVTTCLSEKQTVVKSLREVTNECFKATHRYLPRPVVRGYSYYYIETAKIISLKNFI
jgi:hypothetical protein